jgi:hypothetical protein
MLRKPKTWATVVFALLVLFGTASCSRYGTITGTVREIGGVVPQEPWWVESATGNITARNSRGREFTVPITAEGSFTLELATGRYRLTGYFIPPIGSGSLAHLNPQEITVIANEVANVQMLAIAP